MACIGTGRKMGVWTLWALWWLLVGTAVLWLLVASVGYWVRWGWLPPDASGWVQAIGSIVGIAVAIAIPIYLRVQEYKDRTRDKVEHDIAHSEQLLALCAETLEVASDFDHEAVSADYEANNALRRTVLGDLLQRLNEAQKAELNPERMNVAMRLRFCIFDWLKYFGGEEITDVGRLHNRVERSAPRLARIKVDAENILRRQKGLPLVEYAPPEEEPDDDLPF